MATVPQCTPAGLIPSSLPMEFFPWHGPRTKDNGGSDGAARLPTPLAPERESALDVVWNAAVDSINKTPFTTPHELGHVLLQQGHYLNANPLINLMRSGTSRENKIGASKRFVPWQEQNIYERTNLVLPAN
jgi:hypothetical protein